MEIEAKSLPEIHCNTCSKPVILVCPGIDSSSKAFLCAKCVATGIGNFGKYQNLVEFEDFVSELKKVSGPINDTDAECKTLYENKLANLKTYNERLETMKKVFERLVKNKLSSLYNEKCSELVQKFNSVIDGKSKAFSDLYHSFERQFSTDKESQAEIFKFPEIIQRVKAEKDSGEIEKLLMEIYRKKKSWEGASTGLKSFGINYQNSLKDSVLQVFSKDLSSLQDHEIEGFWNQGLNKLVCGLENEIENRLGQVQVLASTFTLSISSAAELNLVTNSMLQSNVQLQIKLSDEFLEKDLVKVTTKLQSFGNLKSLKCNGDEVQLTKNSLSSILNAVSQNSAKLCEFSVKVENCFNVDQAISALSTEIASCCSLSSLEFILCNTQITFGTLNKLASSIQTPLKKLVIDIRSNDLPAKTLEAVSTIVSNCSNSLECLTLKLGGFSFKSNKISSAELAGLSASITKCNLMSLELDIGNAGLDDECAKSISKSFKEKKSLKNLKLNLFANSITGKGMVRLSNSLTTLFLTNLTLNLHSNPIGDLGVEAISELTKSESIASFSLNLKNVGVKEGRVTELVAKGNVTEISV